MGGAGIARILRDATAADAAALVDRIEREAVADLIACAADPDEGLAATATGPMAIAGARGVSADSGEQFAAVGRRVLGRPASIVDSHDRIAGISAAMADGAA